MSIIQPKVNINIIPAYQKDIAEDQKVLFVGQKISAGTAVSGQLHSKISNENQQDTLFGKKSMLATMIRAAKKLNNVSRMDAIPLDDDGAAVAATGNVAFTGTATAAGKIYVTIGSYINNRYEIDIASGDAATAIGAQLETAITADDTSLVAGVNTTGDVALTAVNLGEEGNKITLKVESSVAGITVALTVMASGATNPTLTDIFDVVGSLRYQTIVWPSTYDLTTVQTFLDDRFNSAVRIEDGIAIVSISDSLANLKTIGSAATRNSQSLAIHGNKHVATTTIKGGAIVEMDYVIASQFGAVRALRMTEGASISQFVDSSQGSADANGGIAIASLPYFNTPFDNLPVIDHQHHWFDTEREELNDAGVFVLGNNIAANKLVCDRVVTTYLTNDIGDPDVTFKYMNYVDTSSVVRWYFHDNLHTRFRQSRLTTGDVVSGRSMANAHIIQGALMGFYKDLTDQALLVGGEAARKAFLDNLIIEIDMATSSATIFMVTQIVTQLEQIDVTMQISFSTTS